MKKLKTKGLIATILVAMIVMLVFVGCTPSHDFTVKIVGPDGKPVTNVMITPCVVKANGEQEACWMVGPKTDSKGIVYFDCGKGDMPEDATALIIHIEGLSALGYEIDGEVEPQVKKGETLTIKLKAKAE